MKHRIIFFGTPEFVVPVLETLYKHFSVVGVVTAPDTIQGRKKLITPPPVKVFAEDHNIPVFQPEKLSAESFTSEIPEVDLYVVAAYGKIIPQAILDLPKYGAMNIHPSLLPKYRGPSPIQTTVLNGDDTTGVTLIKMDEKMDHGPIIYQKEISLTRNETFASLHNSLFQEAAAILPRTIEDFVSGKITPIDQSHEDATYCHMITRESGYFDLENPPDTHTLDQMIRAYYPWPTAWSKYRMQNDECKMIKLLPENKVQLEGGKPMTLKELKNGHAELGENIENILNLNAARGL